MKNTLIVTLLLVLIISCGNMKSKSKSKDVTIIHPVTLTDDFSLATRESAETQILNAVVTDSILTLNVSYNGGCEKHEFSLLGSKMIQKSMPPIRNIMLSHNSNGDDCRELIEEELKFNISDFKYPNGDIMLALVGYKSKILFSAIH